MTRRILSGLFAGSLALAAGAALAQGSECCSVVTLGPGAVSTSLLVEQTGHLSASLPEVIVHPRFGSVAGLTYTPEPDFWRAGVDWIRFRNTVTLEETTVVVRAARMTEEDIAWEGFENLSGGEVSHLDIPSVAVHQLGSPFLTENALSGNWSLAIDLQTAITEHSSEGNGTGHDHQGASVMLATADENDPPFGPLGSSPFESVLVNLGGYAGITLRHLGHITEIGGWASEVLGCGDSCQMPWYPLSPSEPHRLTITLGRHDLENSAAAGWSLTTAFETLDGSWSAVDQLRGLGPPTAPVTRHLGLVQGTPSGVLLIDEASSWTSSLEAPAGLRFEDFAGSWDAAWSEEGAISMAQRQGEFGAAGMISFEASQSGTTSAWTDLAPSGSRDVFAHARVDVSELVLPPGSAFRLFSGASATRATAFYVVLKVSPDGILKAQARLRKAEGGFATSSWAPLLAEVNDLGVAWRANADDSATVHLWVGGEHRQVEHPGAGQGVTIEEIAVGAKFLILGDAIADGGSMAIDDILLSY